MVQIRMYPVRLGFGSENSASGRSCEGTNRCPPDDLLFAEPGEATAFNQRPHRPCVVSQSSNSYGGQANLVVLGDRVNNSTPATSLNHSAPDAVIGTICGRDL